MPRSISELICGIHSNIPLCCVMWYLTGWSAEDRHFQGNWYNTGGNSYIYCPDCVVRIMEKKAKPQKLKDCKCNGYIWNFGDPMVHIIDRGANRVAVSKTRYNFIRIRNRSPIRNTEDIKQENRFYENGVIKI